MASTSPRSGDLSAIHRRHAEPVEARSHASAFDKLRLTLNADVQAAAGFFALFARRRLVAFADGIGLALLFRQRDRIDAQLGVDHVAVGDRAAKVHGRALASFLWARRCVW